MKPLIVALVVACICRCAAVAHGDPPISVHYDDHWQQTLDIYPAVTGCSPHAVVIFIHGGGWVSGDSSEVASYVDSLLQRGFAVASINYRWANNGTFPAQIYDCKGAVRWLRANAAAYDLDPDHFAAFGDSAGAHLAALLGTSGDVAALEGTVGGNLEFSSRVQAVGVFYGPIDLWIMGAIYNGPQSEISQLIGWWIQDVIDHQNDPAYADLVALVN